MYAHLVENVSLYDREWVKIRGDMAFESIAQGYFDYEKTWEKLVRKKGVVVQAGGYCGVFPRLLAETYDQVYTFEPDPLNFFCLSINCQSDNIVKIQGGLSNTYGLLEVVRTNHNNKGMNITRKSSNATIPSFRIDDLGLTSCDLIVLDTEGYEKNILLGAIQTISKFKPVVSVEDTTTQIEELLEDYGYQLRVIVHRDSIYSI